MIETKRLYLRPMTANDFKAIYHLFSDPKVMAAFHSDPLSPKQAQAWLDRNLAHQNEHGYSLFAAVLKENQTFDQIVIGNCGLTHYEIEGKDELEIGYDLHSDFWGQGLATETATAVRDYAFNTLKRPRLIGLARKSNIASQRVLEKIGMVKEKDLVMKNIDYHLFSIQK